MDGCCIDETTVSEVVQPSMDRRARAARAGAGLAQLALGGGLASRKLPGGVALWPVALVPTWFGISHLVAAMIGYRGCPELGAIPTVMLGRPVGTVCEFWDRLDRRLVPAEAASVARRFGRGQALATGERQSERTALGVLADRP
jgi:hypothetical protein